MKERIGDMMFPVSLCQAGFSGKPRALVRALVGNDMMFSVSVFVLGVRLGCQARLCKPEMSQDPYLLLYFFSLFNINSNFSVKKKKKE